MAIILRSVKAQALTKEEQEANIVYLRDRPDGQSYPSDPNIGIQVAGGWSWRSLKPDIRLNGLASDPSLVAYQGSIRQLQFAIDDEISFEYTLPYDYIPGTTVYARFRWSHNSALVTAGAIAGLLEMTYAKGFDQMSFGTPIAMSIPSTASIIRYQNMTIEGPISSAGGVGGILDTGQFEPDGTFLASFKLTSNTMDGGALPFLHNVGLIYQSGIIGTKNKTPNFWV